MKIVVAKETAPGERRVALVPETVGRLTRTGVEVTVARGAGAGAHFPDQAYQDAGATLAEGAGLYSDAAVVARVQPPGPDEIARMPPGSTLISLMPPAAAEATVPALAERGVTALGLERVPRITRAQSMDVLSSQSTVAGYRAVLLGATVLGKFLPMLTTAAGTVAPAKVFVIGAGVAGLQAIATARRLGGVVSGFDIRPAAAEQVQSLGASFVASEAVSQAAEDKGGYARAQSEDEQQRTLATIGRHIRDQDLVITTAQIPGRPAPLLITAEMVQSMRPGSVIVDLAAESGGNCAVSRPGETVVEHDVTVLAPLNVPSTLPMHASQMFSRNMLALLQHLIRDGALVLDPADEITGPMLLTQPQPSRPA